MESYFFLYSDESLANSKPAKERRFFYHIVFALGTKAELYLKTHQL